MSEAMMKAAGYDRPLSRTYETAVLRLPEFDGEARRTVELVPPKVFQPFALLFWDATPGSRVHQIHAGADQLTGMVPALMFEAEVSWSYFLTIAARRPDGIETVDHRSIGKFFRFDMPALCSDHCLRIDIEGGYRHGVVLGKTPCFSLPPPEPGVMPILVAS